jgi:hypothetical protein
MRPWSCSRSPAAHSGRRKLGRLQIVEWHRDKCTYLDKSDGAVKPDQDDRKPEMRLESTIRIQGWNGKIDQR